MEADDYEELVAWNIRLEEPPHGLVDSDDVEDVPYTPTHLLSGLQAKRRKERQEREWIEEQCRPFLEAMAALRAERDRQIEESMPPQMRPEKLPASTRPLLMSHHKCGRTNGLHLRAPLLMGLWWSSSTLTRQGKPKPEQSRMRTCSIHLSQVL